MTRIEEQSLLEKAKKGDISAFEEIVRENEKMVYQLAFRMLNSREDAEDASQEVFLKAYTGLGSFRGESKLSVWLYRITGNVCTDLLRRRKDTLSLSVDTEEGELALDVPDERFDPAAMAEQGEIREALGIALKKLPDDAREILLLREIGGRSYEEIAAVLHLDLGTVKSRIFRARKKLCAALQGNFSGNTSSINGKGGEKA